MMFHSLENHFYNILKISTDINTDIPVNESVIPMKNANFNFSINHFHHIFI